MKLLVTGGSGFIGSHLAENALRANHDVSILGLADLPEEKSNINMLEGLGAKIYPGSVTDQDLCDQAMNGVTHIYHLAVAMREGGESDEYFEQINLAGTECILKAATAKRVKRFVYCSTIGIFGHRFDGIANEDHPLSPGNVYEKTKVAAEKLVLRHSCEKALPVVILRPADVYGPRDHRLLKLFKAINRGRFPLFGDGSGRRHMVYVDDVVSAFRMACESNDAIGKTMIIAGPEVCTLIELITVIQRAAHQNRYGFQLPLKPMLIIAGVVEDIFKKLRLDPPIYRRRMDFFHSDSAFDISRAEAVIGWTPNIGLKEGIRRTLAAYSEANLFD